VSGALAALTGASIAGAGSSGSPGTVSWGPMYGTDTVASNTQALTGFTGVISISAALSGGGTLYVTQNGALSPYTGAFPVRPNDAISWTIAVGKFSRTGTLTVTNATASTTLQTIAYSINTSWNGSGYH
jgi:hypothetical protein